MIIKKESKIISYKMWWWWGLGLLTVAPPIFTGDDSFFKLHIVFNFSELKFRANLFRIKIYGYFIWVQIFQISLCSRNKLRKALESMLIAEKAINMFVLNGAIAKRWLCCTMHGLVDICLHPCFLSMYLIGYI